MLRGHITRKDEAGELTMSLTGPASRFTEAEREKIMATTSQKEMFDIVKTNAFSRNRRKREKEINRLKHCDICCRQLQHNSFQRETFRFLTAVDFSAAVLL